MPQLFPRWPTLTLDTVLAEQYANTPGFFRSVAPAGWDKFRQLEGTGFRRTWNRNWNAFAYARDEAVTATTDGNAGI